MFCSLFRHTCFNLLNVTFYPVLVGCSLNFSFCSQERAKSLNIPTHITIDAGRTQIAPSAFISSFTCGGTLCQDAAFGSPPIRSAHFTQPATLHITEAPEVPLRALSAEVSAVHNTDSRTVMAVLGPADLVDDITGGLKLL
nr:uncharacterized protein LOC104115448 [Nicotiana tomentosiformis]XP_033516989.1 uncharacterized protein LOC104115448 [Nicotiana tomentosiformis]